MIDQLFGSKTRVKLLSLFFNNPNRSFYVREITRKIDEQINSVRRELSNLLTIGIIKSENSNNKLFYEVNQQYQYYEPFRAIFSGIEIASSDEVTEDAAGLTKKFRELGSVKIAYLLGVFLKDPSSEVDLFIVGDVNRTKLTKLIELLEKEESKEINYTAMNEEEFRYRMSINDRFISDIMNAKKTVVIDTINTETEE